jgi:uncharacterized membrane protein
MICSSVINQKFLPGEQNRFAGGKQGNKFAAVTTENAYAFRHQPSPMPINKRTDDIITQTFAGWQRRVFNVLFLTAYVLALARLWWPISLHGTPGWPDAVLLMLAITGTIAALARHLPMQNILSAACCIGFAGGAAGLLDWKTGMPFGAFTPGQSMGPKLFGALPWAVALIWILAVLNSRGVARLILRPWRKLHAYGFWLIGITALLTVLFDLAFEPFASQVKHYWYWGPAKSLLSWQGAPLVNFFGWLVVTLLILAFITPMLINKHPVHQRPPDYHPLGVWLGGILLFGVGSATRGLWPAILLDGIIGVVVVVFAIRGAKW